MKYKKIFTFILLLCTIFSTLFAITPYVKAVNNWDNLLSLEGATVVVPENWSALANSSGYYNVEGTISYNSVNASFTSLGVGYNVASDSPQENCVSYSRALGPTTVPQFVSFTLIFDSGSGLTNTNLIQWFKDNNATINGGIYEEPDPDPTYTISGQYQFNEEITWLYDTSEQEGILYLPFYVYNLDNSTRVNYDYMLNQYREDLDINYFFYANENSDGVFTGQYAGRFTTSTTINMFNERIVYFYTAEASESVYNWLIDNGRFINDPTLDPNNPDNPDSGNNPNNPNNPEFGTDTVRQIVNQVNAFLGIQILPGLSFRDILLICIALPLLMYILKVFLGG